MYLESNLNYPCRSWELNDSLFGRVALRAPAHTIDLGIKRQLGNFHCTQLLLSTMRTPSVIASLSALLLPLVYAADLVVYWDNEDGGYNSLSDICNNSPANIIVLSFINAFGYGQDLQYSLGSCSQSGEGCQDLGNQIRECDSKGKTIFVSLGGSDGSYGLQDDNDAEDVAQKIYSTFLDPSNSVFGGNTIVHGIDFDVEQSTGNDQSYIALIKKLKELYPGVLISAAPECPWDESNDELKIEKQHISHALLSYDIHFDYLFVQFYNNEVCQPTTSGKDGNVFNWDKWNSYGKDHSSSILLGIPASKHAANEDAYLNEQDFKKYLGQIDSSSNFGGVMLWDADQAYKNKKVLTDGSTYDQFAGSQLYG